MTDNHKLYCPDCGNPVAKAGSAWSGRNLRQQFGCRKCGRRTLRPLDAKGNKVEAKPFEREAIAK